MKIPIQSSSIKLFANWFTEAWKFTFLLFILLANTTNADTLSKVDTIKYSSDSMVIEESIAITDTIQMPNNDVEMADVLRSNGKIYIVVIVLLIVLLGVLAFLVNIDKKLKKLEDKNEK